MYNKLLVISDNLYLCKEIEKIIRARNMLSQVTFSISPYSDLDGFESELSCGVISLDLKNRTDVSFILENFDLVLSIHCKQIFPRDLVNNVKCINVHPGYNPINRGWYPQVFAIENDFPVGATIHEIDEQLDHGNIIDRELVTIENTDNSGSLYDKILLKEVELFERNINSIIQGNYKTVTPEGEGNLFLKRDFNNLCEIKLDEKTTAYQLIKRLRALTHHDYKNAYYIDPETNEKIFVSINLSKS